MQNGPSTLQHPRAHALRARARRGACALPANAPLTQGRAPSTLGPLQPPEDGRTARGVPLGWWRPVLCLSQRRQPRYQHHSGRKGSQSVRGWGLAGHPWCQDPPLRRRRAKGQSESWGRMPPEAKPLRAAPVREEDSARLPGAENGTGHPVPSRVSGRVSEWSCPGGSTHTITLQRGARPGGQSLLPQGQREGRSPRAEQQRKPGFAFPPWTLLQAGCWCHRRCRALGRATGHLGSPGGGRGRKRASWGPAGTKPTATHAGPRGQGLSPLCAFLKTHIVFGTRTACWSQKGQLRPRALELTGGKASSELHITAWPLGQPRSRGTTLLLQTA